MRKISISLNHDPKSQNVATIKVHIKCHLRFIKESQNYLIEYFHVLAIGTNVSYTCIKRFKNIFVFFFPEIVIKEYKEFESSAYILQHKVSLTLF